MGKKFADASMAKISSMENRLSGTLKPVRPRQEFVHGLGNRIQSGNRADFVEHIASWPILAMLIAGFVSLAVLLAMVSRALLALAEKKRIA
ncbi:MAG: hypothetical protein WCE68_15520 [Anaerolineales bacterium]